MILSIAGPPKTPHYRDYNLWVPVRTGYNLIPQKYQQNKCRVEPIFRRSADPPIRRGLRSIVRQMAVARNQGPFGPLGLA